MTNPTLTEKDVAEIASVTQADREAAASGYYAWISGNPVIPEKMRKGSVDDHSMVQAFAHHRRNHLISTPNMPKGDRA